MLFTVTSHVGVVKRELLIRAVHVPYWVFLANQKLILLSELIFSTLIPS